MLAYRKKVEGISAARQCFKRAREDHRCGYQIYIAAASVEQFSSPEISLKILDLGLKKFGADFDYIKAYMKFIMNRPNYTSTCSDQDISNHSNNENQNNSSSGKRIVPSVDQMVEFCPKPSSKNFPMIDSLFLVPGGRQKMPSALEKLLEIIPGINEFSGPYIYVDQLVSILDSNTPKKEYASIMRNLSSFNKGLSRTPDPGLVYTIEKFAQNFKMSIANTDTLNNSVSKRNIGHSDIYNRRKKIK
ncbi:MAG: Cleavage stimulation factor subunit 3 [Paramarteilia canceri]